MKNKINLFLLFNSHKTICIYTASYSTNKIIIKYEPFFLHNKKAFYIYLTISGKLIIR